MVYITRRERFSAAHKSAIKEWSDEQNFETFGKCANPNWHGHNYELFVTVKGKPDPTTGFVVNLSTLGDIIKEEIIQYVDHKNMNLDVEFTKHVITSTENLAIVFWQRLESKVAAIGSTLHCIKLQETENNHVEYYGE